MKTNTKTVQNVSIVVVVVVSYPCIHEVHNNYYNVHCVYYYCTVKGNMT